MGRSCPNCGQEMPDLARFCSNCGALLVDLSPDGEVESTSNLDLPVSGTGPLGAVGAEGMGSVAVGSAMLIVRRGPSEGTSFILDSDLITAGRADDSDVVLDDVTVSRRHAEFTRDGKGWQLRDIGSLNGTYVNRERIETITLAGGDEVQLGKYRFVFLLGGGQL